MILNLCSLCTFCSPKICSGCTACFARPWILSSNPIQFSTIHCNCISCILQKWHTVVLYISVLEGAKRLGCFFGMVKYTLKMLARWIYTDVHCKECTPPLALPCGPNVTAKGRLRITGHFGSGLVMPYPCFLSKDNQVWLIAMPVIQSRCLILYQTFSLSPPRS